MGYVSYGQFKMELKAEVEKRLKNTGIQVVIKCVEKNNTEEKEVITFEENDMNVMPAIHLKEFYEYYQNCENMGQLVETILEVLETRGNVEIEGLLGTWTNMKRKIKLKLINADWNQKFLEKVPNRIIAENLALVCYIKIKEYNHGMASMNVQNGFLNVWGISEDTLFETAYRNLYQEQIAIRDMKSVMAELMGENSDEEIRDSSMFVISNQESMYGASAIAREDLLQEFAERYGDFYVLPSSVHECVLLPDTKEVESENLKQMVKEINQTQVTPEEQLSDDVYFYDSKRKKLCKK